MSRLRFGALVTVALVGALLATLVAPARPGDSATATPTPSASDSPTAPSSATPTPNTAPTPTATATPSGSGSTPEPSASASSTPSAQPTPTPSVTPTGPTLWAMLETMSATGLILKSEACTFYPSPTTGCTSAYDRDLFRRTARDWIDADGDGCDSRREVLMAEAVTTPTIGAGCVLSGGQWSSLYDGTTTSGDGGSFDIDHMVPLKEAWISGAYRWSAARREAFANDLGASFSLIAVSASSNRSKSDRDPASWLPTATGYRCRYITDWIAVKLRWALTVDFDEYTVLRDYAERCPAAPYSVVVAP